MLLFQKRFHAGLSSGEITLTFRRWPKARVKPGGRYRCHPIGVLEVDELAVVKISDLNDGEAKAAGFLDVKELRQYLSTATGSPLAEDEPIYRVKLHYGGDGDRVQGALSSELSAEEFATLRRKLDGMDERSAEGPWTRKVLRLIAKRPRIAASKLAKVLRRETLPFKADVVKLKKLGLTQSFEVGYELSPRGQAFLKLGGGQGAAKSGARGRAPAAKTRAQAKSRPPAINRGRAGTPGGKRPAAKVGKAAKRRSTR